jgi:hypothetical protein
MDSERLYQILEETTKVYRKGAIIEKKNIGNLNVIECFGYPHTSKAPINNKYEKVDMIFIDVVVDREKALERKNEVENILEQYPQPERLSQGPCYIELAPNLGLEQEGALRLMAMGKTLGFWNIMSGKIFGLPDDETIEYARNGLLMVDGYRRNKK